ncbi:MAG: hypothetical protein Q9168_001822 [Polycauliona sp. 1 TL-2023]
MSTLRRQALSCLAVLFGVALTSGSHSVPQHAHLTQNVLERRNDSSTLTLATVTNEATWSGWKGVERIFSFGASYTDILFDPTKAQPNATYPLGNPFTNSSTPPYHTFTNGPNWIEYMTFKYNESQIFTYDLALSGAVVNTTAIGQNQPIDLIHQIDDRFVPNYVDKNTCGWNASNSLFTLLFGTNEVDRTWNQQNLSINVAVFESFLGQLNKLYKLGARNFLLNTIPPINRGPHKVQPDKAIEGNDVNDFNYRMTVLFKDFTSAHSDVSVLLFDVNSMYSQIIDDPSSFPQTANLKNTTGSCLVYESKEVPSIDYKDPDCEYAVDEYFWLNGLHPTYRVHEAHAAQVALALAYNS